jgi:broad specificity phosphatase PhoE
MTSGGKIIMKDSLKENGWLIDRGRRMMCGKFILDLLKGVPKEGRTIVLIRHSERPSFTGIPDNLREGVKITPEGVRMARAFGESLAEIFYGKRILLAHTPACRCKMTAESIGEGYSPGDCVRVLGSQLEVESVVLDPDQYVMLRDACGWKHLIQRWLKEEIPEHILRNPHNYCEDLVRKLLSFPEMNDDDLLVVVAHDVTIFPIIFSVFGKPVTSLGFLNGVIMTGDPARIQILYSDAESSLKKEWKSS